MSFWNLADHPEAGSVTHVLNPDTMKWDRIRPLDLEKALRSAVQAARESWRTEDDIVRSILVKFAGFSEEKSHGQEEKG